MNLEDKIEKLAKDIYATGVVIEGQMDYDAQDGYGYFHRMARELYAAGYRKGMDVINELFNRIMTGSEEFLSSMARKHIRKCSFEMIQEIMTEMRMLGYHGMLYEEAKTDLRKPKQITKQEEKQKIKISAILQSRPFENGPFIDVDIGYITALDIADALIADWIGDVSEWKHRAEKTERALRNMASNYWGVECRCLGAYDCEECKKCKDKYILSEENEAVDCLVKVHLEQAEKKLQETNNDD